MTSSQLIAAAFNFLSAGVFTLMNVNRHSLSGAKRGLFIAFYACLFVTMLNLIIAIMLFVYSLIKDWLPLILHVSIPLWVVTIGCATILSGLSFLLIRIMRQARPGQLALASHVLILSCILAIILPTTFEGMTIQLPSLPNIFPSTTNNNQATQQEATSPEITNGQVLPRLTCSTADKAPTKEAELEILRECSLANNYFAIITTLMTIAGSFITAFVFRQSNK